MQCCAAVRLWHHSGWLLCLLLHGTWNLHAPHTIVGVFDRCRTIRTHPNTNVLTYSDTFAHTNTQNADTPTCVRCCIVCNFVCDMRACHYYVRNGGAWRAHRTLARTSTHARVNDKCPLLYTLFVSAQMRTTKRTFAASHNVWLCKVLYGLVVCLCHVVSSSSWSWDRERSLARVLFSNVRGV